LGVTAALYFPIPLDFSYGDFVIFTINQEARHKVLFCTLNIL